MKNTFGSRERQEPNDRNLGLSFLPRRISFPALQTPQLTFGRCSTMLIIPLKAAIRFDLAKALGEWLDDDEAQVSYQPSNPLQMVLPKPDFSSAACQSDLMRIASLRNCLTDILLKADSHASALEEGGMDDLMEYHAVLLEFEKRGFPTLDDDSNRISLKWKGAFGAARAETHTNLLWDRACVTYDIAALLSFQAAQCTFSDRVESKKGVGYCQQAASILETLIDLAASQDLATVDLSGPMLSFWQAYLLAQGQSFVYRMAASGSSQHASLASLSQSAFELFNEALSKAQDARLESEMPKPSKEWAAYCKASAMMAAAKAEFHQAAMQRGNHKYGVEIVRLRRSLTKLNACHEFIESLTEIDQQNAVDYSKRECNAALPVVRDRLTEIERDNYNIYGEDIPKSVENIAPKQLIKTSLGYPTQMLIPQKPCFVGL